MRTDARYGEFPPRTRVRILETDRYFDQENDRMRSILAGATGVLIKYLDQGHLVRIRIGSRVVETVFQNIEAVGSDMTGKDLEALIPEEDVFLDTAVESFLKEKEYSASEWFSKVEKSGLLPQFFGRAFAISIPCTLTQLQKLTLDNRMKCLVDALLIQIDKSVKQDIYH
jgi:hypothetical protein